MVFTQKLSFGGWNISVVPGAARRSGRDVGGYSHIVDLSAVTWGPLVAAPQVGFEHLWPALAASLYLMICEKSSRMRLLSS